MAGLDNDLAAAVGHGVARVDHQVHQELVKLPAIAAHLEPAFDARIDSDASVKRMPRKLNDVVTELRQVDLRMTAPHLARETQQPAGHLGRRSGRRPNVVERFAYIGLADFRLARKPIQKIDAGPDRTEQGC